MSRSGITDTAAASATFRPDSGCPAPPSTLTHQRELWSGTRPATSPGGLSEEGITLRMTKSSLLALGVASLFGATLSAQNCSDNLFALTLVNAAGVPFVKSFDPVIGDNAFAAPT